MLRSWASQNINFISKCVRNGEEKLSEKNRTRICVLGSCRLIQQRQAEGKKILGWSKSKIHMNLIFENDERQKSKLFSIHKFYLPIELNERVAISTWIWIPRKWKFICEFEWNWDSVWILEWIKKKSIRPQSSRLKL